MEPPVKKKLKLKKAVDDLTLQLNSLSLNNLEDTLEKPKKPKKLVLKKRVPPTPQGTLTPTMEIFEAIRKYYAERGQEIPQDEVQWYLNELEQEKKELKEFWDTCPITWAILQASANGQDIEVAETTALTHELSLGKKAPIVLGEMPSYGTPEFWAWCRKKKQIRLEKEAEIIAAGGTVPVKTKAKKI